MRDDGGKALAIGRHIRSRSHEAHGTQEYIEKLRQLIEVRTPKPATQWRYTAIIPYHRALVGV
jgi:hypothetical protein